MRWNRWNCFIIFRMGHQAGEPLRWRGALCQVWGSVWRGSHLPWAIKPVQRLCGWESPSAVSTQTCPQLRSKDEAQCYHLLKSHTPPAKTRPAKTRQTSIAAGNATLIAPPAKTCQTSVTAGNATLIAPPAKTRQTSITALNATLIALPAKTCQSSIAAGNSTLIAPPARTHRTAVIGIRCIRWSTCRW